MTGWESLPYIFMEYQFSLFSLTVNPLMLTSDFCTQTKRKSVPFRYFCGISNSLVEREYQTGRMSQFVHADCPSHKTVKNLVEIERAGN